MDKQGGYTTVPDTNRANYGVKLSGGDTSDDDTHGVLGEIKNRDIRGNHYLIRGGSTLEHETEGQMFDDIYAESMNMSANSRKRARIFKILNLVSNLVIIVGGGMVGLMGIFGINILSIESTPLFGIMSVFGTIAAVTKIIEWAVGFKKKSLRFKDTYHRLKEIVKEVRSIHESTVGASEKTTRYEKYWAELDGIDLNIFDNRLNSGGKKNQTSLKKSKKYTPYESYDDIV